MGGCAKPCHDEALFAPLPCGEGLGVRVTARRSRPDTEAVAQMRATVTDIARNCALSTATVDRVLNNRGGVSATNRQRVLQAAKQLGYLPTLDAVTLPSRPAHIEFFLPVGANSFIADLAQHIVDFAARLPLVASCRIHLAQRDLALGAPGGGRAPVADRQRRRRHCGRSSEVPQYPARDRRRRAAGRDARVGHPGGAAVGLCRHRQPGGGPDRRAVDGAVPRRPHGHARTDRRVAQLSGPRGARGRLSIGADGRFHPTDRGERHRCQRRAGRGLPGHGQGAALGTRSPRHLLRRRRPVRHRAGHRRGQAAAQARLHLPRPDPGHAALPGRRPPSTS